MNKSARDKILAKLYNANKHAAVTFSGAEALPAVSLSGKEKIEQIKKHLEAVRSEVYVVPAKKWINKLKEILNKRGLKTLLYAPDSSIGADIQKGWKKKNEDLPQLVTFEGDIETFKPKLFETDASITTTVGGIADTGALILWPNQQEPRLMSLVPPVHIAILESSTIYHNFSEAIQREEWNQKNPVNALLISGPSKTADIELTLAFGVHGPKELIVIILED